MNSKNEKKKYTHATLPNSGYNCVSAGFMKSHGKTARRAEDCFRAHSVPRDHWEVVSCPGAFELPQVANRIAAQKKPDAIVCLGAVVRGENAAF